jgi:FtsP/CotA-like multicopper oxidase with cupredoxin domain
VNKQNRRAPLARRRFLVGLAGLASLPLLPLRGSARSVDDSTLVEARLVARAATSQLAPKEYPGTAVWGYNGSVPGPVLRVRHGDRLRVMVENRLDEGTTVHWHGVRVPNAMDGVPVITQPLIEPQGSFTYEFVPPDAGTFLYHPHQRSYEQMGRGLAGALIVEEREPPQVDRDLVWVLGDFRLEKDASIRGGFGSFMDASHNGRVGNTVTINGSVPDSFPVRGGERIRLRLVAATTARIFALDFGGLRPWIVALDGQPVEPHQPDGGVVIIAPAQRADLILDLTGAPGSRHELRDVFYRGREYRVVDLAYSDEPPLRARPPEPPGLPRNALSEPDMQRAERHEVVFSGGMMGSMRGMRRGMAWAVNGASNGCGEGASAFDPLFVLRLGRSYLLKLGNNTAWHHPIHLHGHSFRVVTRNGKPSARREWLDTVLLAPRETAEIAFVADNPGDWMFHCHVLEHQASGMMACIRVL